MVQFMSLFTSIAIMYLCLLFTATARPSPLHLRLPPLLSPPFHLLRLLHLLPYLHLPFSPPRTILHIPFGLARHRPHHFQSTTGCYSIHWLFPYTAAVASTIGPSFDIAFLVRPWDPLASVPSFRVTMDALDNLGLSVSILESADLDASEH